MGSRGTLVSGLLLLLASATAAGAQDAQQPVLIYDYAISHPVEDAQLPTVPSVGVSVPPAVVVATVEGTDGYYGYFYFQGRPVIVDMTTRSVIRVGN